MKILNTKSSKEYEIKFNGQNYTYKTYTDSGNPMHNSSVLLNEKGRYIHNEPLKEFIYWAIYEEELKEAFGEDYEKH